MPIFLVAGVALNQRTMCCLWRGRSVDESLEVPRAVTGKEQMMGIVVEAGVVPVGVAS